MSLYLADTDWIVDSLHGKQAAIQALLDLAPAGLAVSLISYGELYEGAYYARNPQSALEGVRTFLEGKELLPLTTGIMERFAIIRPQPSRSVRNQIGDMDLLIAVTALVQVTDLPAETQTAINRLAHDLMPATKGALPSPSMAAISKPRRIKATGVLGLCSFNRQHPGVAPGKEHLQQEPRLIVGSPNIGQDIVQLIKRAMPEEQLAENQRRHGSADPRIPDRPL